MCDDTLMEGIPETNVVPSDVRMRREGNAVSVGIGSDLVPIPESVARILSRMLDFGALEAHEWDELPRFQSAYSGMNCHAFALFLMGLVPRSALLDLEYRYQHDLDQWTEGNAVMTGLFKKSIEEHIRSFPESRSVSADQLHDDIGRRFRPGQPLLVHACAEHGVHLQHTFVVLGITSSGRIICTDKKNPGLPPEGAVRILYLEEVLHDATPGYAFFVADPADPPLRITDLGRRKAGDT